MEQRLIAYTSVRDRKPIATISLPDRVALSLGRTLPLVCPTRGFYLRRFDYTTPRQFRQLS